MLLSARPASSTLEISRSPHRYTPWNSRFPSRASYRVFIPIQPSRPGNWSAR